MRLAIFPSHLSKVLRLPRQVRLGHTKCRAYHAKSCKIMYRKPEDLMLQNAVPLRLIWSLAWFGVPPISGNLHISHYCCLSIALMVCPNGWKKGTTPMRNVMTWNNSWRKRAAFVKARRSWSDGNHWGMRRTCLTHTISLVLRLPRDMRLCRSS